MRFGFIAALVLLAPCALSAAACSAPGSSSGPPAGNHNGPDDAGMGMMQSGAVSLPFVVSDQFVPSGFMGDSPADFNAMMMSADATKCMARKAGAQGACYTITWTPQPLSGQKTAWVGVYWQYPANNWGGKPGKAIAAGATKVTFSAAGGAGGESLKFMAGGMNKAGDPMLAYSDSFLASTQATLTTAWADYSIALDGASYTSVIGGFAFAITTTTTDPVTLYIDDIKWE